jgi:NAD(P)-dependent dehydrogenase (short-subunit alcohol dehydrogenase family)
MGSVSGVEADANGAMYSVSKSGLSQFTKCLALAGAPDNVRAVCVAPGPVMTRPGMANMHTPLNRAAEPIEVVNLIQYLLSEKASFISGSTHFIDGARNANFGK